MSDYWTPLGTELAAEHAEHTRSRTWVTGCPLCRREIEDLWADVEHQAIEENL